MNKLSKLARLLAAASLLVLAACGGGGGGGAPATNIVSSPTGSSAGNASGSGGSTTDTSSGGNSASGGSTTGGSTSSGGGTTTTGGSTGGSTPPTFATFATGSVDKNLFSGFTSSIVASGTPTLAAPLSPTKGTNPTAAPSGFTQPLTTNPSFPLYQTVTQTDASGIRPANQVVVPNAPSPMAGGATLTVTNWNPNGTSDFVLSIPGLGLVGSNAKAISSPSLLKGASTFSSTGFRLTATNNDYVALGLWEVNAANPTTVFLGTFVTGYETPVSAVPTSGTATYFATQNVAAIVSTYNASGGQLSRGSVLGDASFTANFSTGSLTGTLSNNAIIYDNGKAAFLPWNDVSVSASIAGNTFSGSAVAGTSSATNAYTVNPGATGKFDGGFYGPNADALGAVFSLTDSTHVVTGVTTGRQH